MSDRTKFRRELDALVVGGGSIGTRHATNLLSLGVQKVTVVEPDASRKSALAEKGLISTLATLDQALKKTYALAIVATPTYLHAEEALLLLAKKIPVFVEKPIAHDASRISDLKKASEGVLTMVGCNMRFHPGPRCVKELLDQGVVGRAHFARIHTGSFLPEWRPSQDYRKGYSGNAAMGGGCLLDCIHELDLARWYCGDVTEVYCRAEKISSLEIDVEDFAALVCKHASGVVSEVHLDYVQRSYERGCHIAGDKGSLFWDYNQRQVRQYVASTKQWVSHPEPANWAMNQMYLDEMDHFLSCLENQSPSIFPISEAIEVLQIALTAKQSACDGKAILTRRAA